MENKKGLDQVHKLSQNKGKCFDMFQQLKINGRKMYQRKSCEQILKFKINLSHREDLLMKLKFIKCLNAYSGATYIHLLLQQISLSKELLQLHIEQGDEVLIPAELSQNHLPQSFRFYDPILQMVERNFSEEKKNFYLLRNHLIQTKINSSNFPKLLKQQAGLLPKPGQEKLHINLKQLNSKQVHDVNYMSSDHSMGIQRSSYIIIEANYARLSRQYYQKEDNHLSENDSKMLNKNYCALNLRFCPAKEVNDKRIDFIRFKATYLYKMHSQMIDGETQSTIFKIEAWLYQNIDKLWNKYLAPMDKPQSKKQRKRRNTVIPFSNELLKEPAEGPSITRRQTMKRA